MAEDNKNKPVMAEAPETPKNDTENGGEGIEPTNGHVEEGEKYNSTVNNPLQLMRVRDDRQPSFLSPIWNPVTCAIAGFTVAIFLNWGFMKPPFAGIQRHIIYTIAGGLIGKYFDDKQNVYYAKRDAVMKHYIELHEDDFPIKERVKYGNILETWVPIR